MVGMTEPSAPDPLAAVKARWFTDDQHRAEYWADLASRDVPWLIGEVERLRAVLRQDLPSEAEDQALTEIARQGGPEADRALAEGRTRPLPEVLEELGDSEAGR
jgi:hypothetical protein